MKNTLITHAEPAGEWIEGDPIGNGSIGAMVWGAPGTQIFSLNHERLWRHKYAKEIRTAALIPELRRLVLAGKAAAAHERFVGALRDLPDEINSYQPFCDLILKTDCAPYRNYLRALDVENGVLTVTCEAGENAFRFSSFASQNRAAVVVCVTAQKPCDFELALEREPDSECGYRITADGSRVLFDGRFAEGVTFSSAISAEPADGLVLHRPGGVSVVHTTAFELRIALATSYECADPAGECKKRLDALQGLSGGQLYGEHTELFREKFDRMRLSLGGPADRTTGELAADLSGTGPSLPLYEQFFNMARYLMISSACRTSMPVNLQGLWNRSTRPMWECSHTMDMNTQMDYGLCHAGNLADCEESLFNWIDQMLPVMRKQCRDIFGVGGVYIPQYTDTFMVPCKCDWAGSFQILWTGAAAWIAQHYYEHYRYTDDTAFLFEKAYPYMKECAAFYRGYLVKNDSGRYILCPSASPENLTADRNWLVNTATMDIALVKELTENLLAVDEKFCLHDPDANAWRDLHDNIVDFPVTRDENGRVLWLEEWVDPAAQGDLGHRHLSHLYGLYPSKLFFKKGREELKAAAVGALARRRQNGFGSCATWSHAWYACCFARIGDGDAALDSLRSLMETGMTDNLLTTHNDWRGGDKTGAMIGFRLFQIEAVFGAATAVCEMLLQSYEDRIAILPALPKLWPQGRVQGICAYGGLTFDIAWKDGRFARVVLHSTRAGRAVLDLGADTETVHIDGRTARCANGQVTVEYGAGAAVCLQP